MDKESTPKTKIKVSIWETLNFTIPTIIGMSIGDGFAETVADSMIYSGVGAMFGALLGVVTNQIVSNKSLRIKIVSSVALTIISFMIMVFILTLPNDVRLVKKEWVEQEFKGLIFETPSKLTFEKKQLEISNQTRMVFEDFELFDDTEMDRVHSLVRATIKSEWSSMESIFELLSNEFLKNYAIEGRINVLDFEKSDDFESYVRFELKVNDKKLSGFAFFFIENDMLYSLWLVPIKKGFSKDYIDKFEDSIF